jgi:hypothetical protein
LHIGKQNQSRGLRKISSREKGEVRKLRNQASQERENCQTQKAPGRVQL